MVAQPNYDVGLDKVHRYNDRSSRLRQKRVQPVLMFREFQRWSECERMSSHLEVALLLMFT